MVNNELDPYNLDIIEEAIDILTGLKADEDVKNTFNAAVSTAEKQN